MSDEREIGPEERKFRARIERDIRENGLVAMGFTLACPVPTMEDLARFANEVEAAVMHSKPHTAWKGNSPSQEV